MYSFSWTRKVERNNWSWEATLDASGISKEGISEEDRDLLIDHFESIKYILSKYKER